MKDKINADRAYCIHRPLVVSDFVIFSSRILNNLNVSLRGRCGSGERHLNGMVRANTALV